VNQTNVHETNCANYGKSQCCCSAFLKLSTECCLITLAGKRLIFFGKNKYLQQSVDFKE